MVRDIHFPVMAHTDYYMPVNAFNNFDELERA